MENLTLCIWRYSKMRKWRVHDSLQGTDIHGRTQHALLDGYTHNFMHRDKVHAWALILPEAGPEGKDLVVECGNWQTRRGRVEQVERQNSEYHLVLATGELIGTHPRWDASDEDWVTDRRSGPAELLLTCDPDGFRDNLLVGVEYR